VLQYFRNTEFHIFFMNTTILTISERGQITIPKKIRQKLKVQHVSCTLEDSALVLRPLQTREEFFAELDVAEKEWQKKGGVSLAEMKKKYDL